MAENSIGEEIESTYIMGGEVIKGTKVFWKNIAYFGFVDMIYNLKKFIREHGDGPFTVLGVVRYGERSLMLQFENKYGKKVEINEDYFCSDQEMSFLKGEELRLAV